MCVFCIQILGVVFKVQDEYSSQTSDISVYNKNFFDPLFKCVDCRWMLKV